MDWAVIFDSIHAAKATREIVFKRAYLSGEAAAYAADRPLQAAVQYRQVGFDPESGVLFPREDTLLHVWLRDWFDRAGDGATEAELQTLVSDLRGQVVETNAELWSRFVVDGRTYKYASHQFDHRPDGVIFAFIVRLQAS